MVPALGDSQSIGTASDNTFVPSSVTVTVGDTVTISNTSGGFYDLHWDDRSMPDTGFESDWSTQRTFDTAGTYGFYSDTFGGPGGVGMSGTVTVVDPPPPATTTTGTSTTPAGTSTTPTTPTSTTPAGTTPTETTPETASSASGSSASRDRRAPKLTAGVASLRHRLQLAFSVNETARVVATVRGTGLRTTLRFILVSGSMRRVVLPTATAGRYTIILTAVDEAGNRTRAVRKTVRVRP